MNIGMVYLQKARVDNSSSSNLLLNASQTYFNHAIRWNDDNERAYRGLGFALMDLKADEEAVRVWENVEGIERELLLLGNQAYKNRDYDSTAQWYTAAVRVAQDDESTWNHLAALALYTDAFSEDDAKTWYEKYVNRNDGNFIVNGGFENRNLGWSFYKPSQENSAFGFDDAVYFTSPVSSFVRGDTDEWHGGWYQILFLEEGKSYLVSARMRALGDESLRVETLYRETVVNGKNIGHRGEIIEGSFNWTYFETRFIFTASDAQRIVLYPARVGGRGQVWVDDVKLIPAPVGDN